MKRISRVLFVTYAVGIIALVGYSWFWGAPKARSKLPKIKAELGLISPPSGARYIGEWNASKMGFCVTQHSYYTNQSWQQLKDYYDAIFIAQGWKLGTTEQLSGDVADPSYIANYWKEDLHAKLQFGGFGERSDRNYTLSIRIDF